MFHQYRRASTTEQQLGPQAQADVIGRWLTNAWQAGATDTVRDYLDAGVSGSIPLAERPDGAEMLASLNSGDTVIVAKLDRLFRSTADAATTLDDWCKRGIKFVSIHEGFDMTTSMGRFMASVMAAFAELERAMIRERTSAAIQRKIANGDHHGAIPYGWNRVKGKLSPRQDEQIVIAKIRELIDAKLTRSRVVDYLNTHNYYSKRGGLWTERKIYDTLDFDYRMRRIGVTLNPEATDVCNPISDAT